MYGTASKFIGQQFCVLGCKPTKAYKLSDSLAGDRDEKDYGLLVRHKL